MITSSLPSPPFLPEDLISSCLSFADTALDSVLLALSTPGGLPLGARSLTVSHLECCAFPWGGPTASFKFSIHSHILSKVSAPFYSPSILYFFLIFLRKHVLLFDMAFPGSSVVKNQSAMQETCRRHGFNRWVGKIPWKRKWQPTAVTLPGKSRGQRSLAGWFNRWVGKIPWKRKWQPTAVTLPGKSRGQRSLAGCSTWGHRPSDTTARHAKDNQRVNFFPGCHHQEKLCFSLSQSLLLFWVLCKFSNLCFIFVWAARKF